jgi:aspartate carbamoyltransferase catalytic subunit
MRHLLSTSDLTKDYILEVIRMAEKYLPAVLNKKVLKDCRGKLLAALFYEPSTRTRLSTETAMIRLGGEVIQAVGEENSSLKKGETLYDTARVVSQYADIIAIRHSKAHSAAEFAIGSNVPVINCGDGANDHPTQALLDAFTIYKQFNRLDNLTVAYVGDLKNSRVTHADLKLLSNFGGRAKLLSPSSLELPEEYYFDGIDYVKCDSLEECVKDADIILSSRMQKERFNDINEYEKLKAYFIFKRDFLEKNAPNAILLAPLPRIDEIDLSVDDWKGARYFDAISYGVAVRMALIKKMLCTS